MANLMYMDMGMSVIGAVSQYSTASANYRMEQTVRKYQERMAKLSEGMSLDAITRNEAQTIEQNVFANVSIQSAAMQEQADFAVEAAASGIVGNSVSVGNAQLKADASRAQTSRRRAFKQTMYAHGQQRTQVKLQTVYGRDVSPIAVPDFGRTVFGIVTGLVDIYDEHNPTSRQSSALLSK